MSGRRHPLRRRTVLSALGAGIAAGVVRPASAGSDTPPDFALVQGDTCVPVRPLQGGSPADGLYEYQLPERYVSDENGAVVGDTAPYASAGTQDLQRPQTSIAFLYRGPDGLSLVVVHGKVDADDAGSVTFRLAGLPDDGRWLVKDDFYRDPNSGEIATSNYDRWYLDRDPQRIDWTWGSAGTDGGVFRGLGDDIDVTIDPAFNEEAPLFNEYYEGTVTDWQFLTATDGGVERVALDRSTPIRVTTGPCDDASAGSEQRRRSDRQRTERTQSVEAEQTRTTDGASGTDQRQSADVEQTQASGGSGSDQRQSVTVEQTQASGGSGSDQRQSVTVEQTQTADSGSGQSTQTQSERTRSVTVEQSGEVTVTDGADCGEAESAIDAALEDTDVEYECEDGG
ncbi:hypothetical protein G9464_02470 [Halostella sp. JP-L12]|uniref:hypothetical protein n=1 Tax=Halostella TaxID=1843185 RepID=UPI0013CE6E7D|nr:MULTISPECIES: hypothetical protein [Halostella]NHN46466.1 hypothetical protein [Halostella sp. JP-L12]